MEFFVDNWLWFLVGAIVILMTLIGYIAEKTDFGRKDIPKKEKIKKEKPKKEKKQPSAKEELKEVLESEPMPEVQMSLATDSIFEEPVQTLEELDNTNIETKTMEDLNVPFGDISFEEQSVEEAYEPVENLNNSFEEFTYAEPTSVEAPVETFEPMEELTSVDEETEEIEDLNVPLGDTTYAMPINEVEEVVASEPVEELNLEDLNTPNIELPDLDSIVTEEDDTDDVWKF